MLNLTQNYSVKISTVSQKPLNSHKCWKDVLPERCYGKHYKHILDTMSQFYFTFNKKFPLNRRIITRLTRVTRTRGVPIRASKTWGSRTRVSRCGAVSPGDTGG